MVGRWKKAWWGLLAVPFVVLGAWLSQLDRGIDMQLARAPAVPLHIVVSDPLCDQPADADHQDPHRDYAPLGRFLEETVGRPVEISYAGAAGEMLRVRQPADVVFGPEAAVQAEAAQKNEPVRPVARLTDQRGFTDLAGVFVVRADDPAQRIADLAGHQIVFGPVADEERHAWALATLSQLGIVPVPPLKEVPSCHAALQALAQRQADAAVISSYALALVETEGAAGHTAFRVVGQTPSRPFITAFVTGGTGPVSEQAITKALLSVQEHPPLLAALASKVGFVPLEGKPASKKNTAAPAPATEWTDWRGPGRAAVSPDVPAQLPATAKFLWTHKLTGPGLSGIAATATRVVVADKSEQKDPGSPTQKDALGSPQDIWRCLDARTGKELWTFTYATPKQMEFTNAPRATPVIHGNFVYLLGAFGDLYCVNLYGSGVVWHKDIIKDFGAKLPPWGTCATPLVVGDTLIVNPGAPDASLVALSLYTGEVIWKTAGAPAAYGSLILGTFGGVRQIVGHDAASLGGWDPNTGKRLWTLPPEKKGDYNVPTPIDVSGRLLVATENNGTRLYDFENKGRIQPVLVAQTRALAPDTSTPVVVDGLVFGCSKGLFCLDLNDGLKTLYTAEPTGAFKEYAAFIAGPGRASPQRSGASPGQSRVLAVTVEGELVLFQASRDGFKPISRLRVFDGTEVWSHPALVGHRLYLRSMTEVCCLLLSDS